jgi:membrane-bound lytic murein transglycosylase A
LQEAQFDELGTWKQADVAKSLVAFQESCKLWTKLNPMHSIGNPQIPMTVKDWLPICNQALKIPNPVNDRDARKFFETYFRPFHWKNYHKGKFTGYYSPTIEGSTVKTADFKVPVYDLPKDLVTANTGQRHHRHVAGHVVGRRLKPYFTRAQIYQGAIRGKAKIVAWLKSPLDAMLLEIEGSGVIETRKGEQIFVGYAAENGRKYKSIAQLLISHHAIKRNKASVKGIKNYFEKHPQQIKRYVQMNPSFVFFSRYKKPAFKGAQNVVLTPKYSLAVDRRYIPLGVPLFLKTTYPVNRLGDTAELNRLMIAQDTGGAIRGPSRGDIYWGTGNKAMEIASKMSHEGDYWFLLPKHYHLT